MNQKLIITTFFLATLSASAVDRPQQGKYKVTQLPLSDSAMYFCGETCDTRYPFYALNQLDPQLQKVMDGQNQRNVFGLDGDSDDGYYFLPSKGDIQLIIASRAIVANSRRLMTLKNNQVIDQILISYGGPDDSLVIDFEMDKNYRLTIKKGSVDADHEQPVVWDEFLEYQLSDDGKLIEIKKNNHKSKNPA